MFLCTIVMIMCTRIEMNRMVVREKKYLFEFMIYIFWDILSKYEYATATQRNTYTQNT